MTRPQQPELARSDRTDVDPDHVRTTGQPPTGGKTGPVPDENQPGHRPDEEQDKPEIDAFTARFRGEDRPSGREPVAVTVALIPLRLGLYGLRTARRLIERTIGR